MTTYTVTRFHVAAPHADTLLGARPTIAEARKLMRDSMLGRGEGIEVIDDAAGTVVAKRGAKR